MTEATDASVQTVLGPVPGGELGMVLAHEHILFHWRRAGWTTSATDPEGRIMAEQPVSLDNLWWVRQNNTASRDNATLEDEDTAAAELGRFAAVGGRTIVELTPNGLGRDPAGLARVARASGVNVVMGSGYYTSGTHPPDLASRDVSDITDELVGDVMIGVGSTEIRSGAIGEVGCSWPIDDVELRVLQAAAKAQRMTGAPVFIHPGRHPNGPLKDLRAFEDAGGDPSRTVMSHVDRRIGDKALLEELAQTGCYLEFDCFGLEPWLDDATLTCPQPCDLERVQLIEWLMSAGHAERILISQDIAMKHRLTAYGGHGYDHIIRNIVPLFRGRGASEDEIGTILIDNPRRVLESGEV